MEERPGQRSKRRSGVRGRAAVLPWRSKLLLVTEGHLKNRSSGLRSDEGARTVRVVHWG